MASEPVPLLLAPEEYLALDRAAELKSEFYRGQTFAMAGASERHNLIVLNVAAELRLQLKGSPCRTYPSDLRVKVPASGFYTYPDASVACEPVFEDERRDTLLTPTLIVEVLSASTEAYDRGRKFQLYRTIASFREYLLVSQEIAHVEQFIRQADGYWVLSEASGREAILKLASLSVDLPLAEVYDKVELDEQAALRPRMTPR